MGAKMEGQHAFALNYNLILRIPQLRKNPAAHRAIMYWVVDPRAPSVLAPFDGSDVWAFGILLPPGVTDISEDDVRQRRCGGRTGRGRGDRRARHLGRASPDRGPLSRPACSPRRRCLPPASALRRIQHESRHRGRCRSRLEAVGRDRGWGGDVLLDSYEQERRAVHQRTVNEAMTNYKTLPDHLLKENLDADTPRRATARARTSRTAIVGAKTREFKTLGVVLGSRYENSPIIVDDGSTPPEEHHANFVPSAHPGCLAPHAWLDDGSSLYDPLRARLQPAAARQRPGGIGGAHRNCREKAGVHRRKSSICAAPVWRSFTKRPLALVRPDQFVAWRGTDVDATTLVDTIRGMNEKVARRAAS